MEWEFFTLVYYRILPPLIGNNLIDLEFKIIKNIFMNIKIKSS